MTNHRSKNLKNEYPPDTGCEVSPLCIKCPLPICKHDDPEWYRRYRGRAGDLSIVDGGGSAATIAEKHGIAERQVYRIRRRLR